MNIKSRYESQNDTIQSEPCCNQKKQGPDTFVPCVLIFGKRQKKQKKHVADNAPHGNRQTPKNGVSALRYGITINGLGNGTETFLADSPGREGTSTYFLCHSKGRSQLNIF